MTKPTDRRKFQYLPEAENDFMLIGGSDDPSDENLGMTLRQGRENYQRWGAVRRDLARHARKPRQEEIPDQQT